MDYGGAMIRLYVAQPKLAAGLVFAPDPGQAHYLSAVMRLKAGDEIAVFNGLDGEWQARVSEAGKKRILLEAIQALRPQTAPRRITLAIAMVKRSALEYAVEKATELGVEAIDLVITQRSNAVHTKVERLDYIAIESAEQTERLELPQIRTPVKFDAWLSASQHDLVIFGDEDSTHEGDEKPTRSLLEVLQGVKAEPSYADASIAVVIGPEGGFNDDERRALRAHPRVKPVNLGPRILRADTAAISALTLVQAVLGDWR